MFASSRSSPNDSSSGSQRYASWVQWALLGIGGLFFLSGILLAVGVPDAPLDALAADDGDESYPTPVPEDDSTAEDANAGGESAATNDGGKRDSGTDARQSDPPDAPETTEPTETATATPTPSPSPGGGAEPVYRINVGGPRIAVDGGLDWSPDTADAPSSHFNSGRTDTVAHRTPDEITTEDDVPSTAPDAMFQTYRFDRGSDDEGDEEMVWRFPVDPNRAYEVRLYVVEPFFTDGESGRDYERPYDEGGPRSFGVEIGGETAMENYEPFREHGHDVGAVQSFKATDDDGVIEVRFLREVENPTVSGIEIVDAGPRDGDNGDD
ncbi:malectin domain-containing carbohydrate-binding protein [Halegenticoccus tardaugens]|uniref:malectin domain-containing carbohydrate-binding protein n=1 Tax=Halegenticoccus tardaugens TaxID=2071624 RepID=UPI00100B3B90|nr:malectin domain-containing carbohydrate-binding protein [Halegenticoccus tardaugens]